MIKYAYAYIRVSSKGQIKKHGFTRQRQTINKFAKKNGYSITGFFKEGVSGTKDETHRPQFTEMIQAMLSNSVKVVIVESLDRLAREYRIQEQLIIYMASKEMTLINASTGENITDAVESDPMRKALVQIQGIFAELDKNLLIKKLRKARNKKRKETGKCEGRKAFGETKAEQKVIKKMAALRRKHKSGMQRSYDEIAKILNKQNITTKMGKQWTRGQVCRYLNRER